MPVISLENLLNAWEEFRKGKSKKYDVILFERNLEDNIFDLYNELSSKTYRHQPYSTFHIWDPKHRIIRKASVRDRVVHHLLFRYLESLYQPRFIHQSYSCQKGKGIHTALEEVHTALRKVSKNYTQTIWSLKLDIRKFFDSVDQSILMSLLRKKVSDEHALWLLEEIVRSYSSPFGQDKGVPIGNLTSQIFANIYLSELDYYVKHVLKVRHYFRYADDTLFLHQEKPILETYKVAVQQFIEQNLQLYLHPNKISFRKLGQGTDFVGYVLLPHYRLLRTTTKQRMFKKMRQKVEAYNCGRLSGGTLEQSKQSYLGLLKHCQGYGLEQQLRNEVWMNKKNFAGQDNTISSNI